MALRRSVTFQQPISFFIVTDRWRKTWLLSTSPNKRLPSIHLLKNFGFTSVNLLGRFVARSSPMVDQGMFNLQLTSINRCFFEIQGISSFFRPSPLPRLLPNNAPQHTWSRCVLLVGMRTSAYQGDRITSCKPLTTKGQSRTTASGAPGSSGVTHDCTSKYRDPPLTHTLIHTHHVTIRSYKSKASNIYPSTLTCIAFASITYSKDLNWQPQIKTPLSKCTFLPLN